MEYNGNMGLYKVPNEFERNSMEEVSKSWKKVGEISGEPGKIERSLYFRGRGIVCWAHCPARPTLARNKVGGGNGAKWDKRMKLTLEGRGIEISGRTSTLNVVGEKGTMGAGPDH